MQFLHLCTTNDINGNPRRLYVRMDKGGCFIAAWDEGYRGSGAVPEAYRDEAHKAPYIEITPREYRRIKKEYGATRIPAKYQKRTTANCPDCATGIPHPADKHA